MPLFNCAGGNGGGGGGTSDYEQLSNLPQVNNNILIGNKSASDLGLVGAVTGKGLSTNDYTDADKGIVDGVTSALAGKVDTSLVGSANGVAELDSNGRVPSSQLPSYVDDVLEYADLAHFPATGETGKIYIADDTNKTYRWSGSDYTEISESLALGETSSTAYAGNKGKANADAISAIKDGTNIDSFADVESALAGKASTNDLGDKSNLTTTDKSNIVSAINEVNDKVGYEERTTRESTQQGVYVYNNRNFLSSGYITITKVGNKMSICVSGISTKSGSDWIVEISDGYRPATQNDRLYFKYFLGTTEYTGFIVAAGNVYFDNLNTTDLLSANIEFNIAT